MTRPVAAVRAGLSDSLHQRLEGVPVGSEWNQLLAVHQLTDPAGDAPRNRDSCVRRQVASGGSAA